MASEFSTIGSEDPLPAEASASAQRPRRARQNTSHIQYDGRMVWVKGDSMPGEISKQITGAALPGARNGFPVYLFSKFAGSTNTAAKAIVNADRRLGSEATRLGAIPSFRENRTELTLKVIMVDPSLRPEVTEDDSVLSVAGKTDPKILAGAIAKPIREGNRVQLRGIGSKAVFEMFRGIAICRAYLEADGEGADVLVFPEFVEVQLEGRDGKTSALSIVVVPTSSSSEPAEDAAEDA